MKKLFALLMILLFAFPIGGCSHKHEDELKAEIQKIPGVEKVTLKYDPLPPTHNYSVTINVRPNTDLLATLKEAGGLIYHKGQKKAMIWIRVLSASGEESAVMNDLGISSMEDYAKIWGEQ